MTSRARRIGSLLLIATLSALVGACAATGPEASPESEAEIDPGIYTRQDDPEDPYRAVYAAFRARRARDRVSPDSPAPLPRYPARHRTADRVWAPLETILAFDWAAIERESPGEAASLRASFRLRRAFDHPDLEILEAMLGPGGVLPRHAEGAPGMWVVVGGEGVLEVDGERRRVTPGATAKLEPFAVRRAEATSDAPLRWLWVRWAPGGDQAYIDSGYYLTGANQHRQPDQAHFEGDYFFWEEAGAGDSAPTAMALAPSPGRARNAAVRDHGAVRGALENEGRLYPDVPVFRHERDVRWPTADDLKRGGFFFSKDFDAISGILEQVASIARHKAIFRATRPDGRWDFNFSQSAWGPRATYVEHSHVIPEFYYVLSGPVVYGVDGEGHESLPGDILFNNSYSPHWAQGIVDGLVFRSFSSTFAPNGDRSVFDRPAFLLERPPAQPAGARLPTDVAFH